MERKAGNGYSYHVDLLRFLFSLIIVYYHILHANIMDYVTDPLYTTLGEKCSFSSNIVVCFFILSGLFMYRSYVKKPDTPIFGYICGRAARLGPVLITALLAEGLVSGFNWPRILLNSLFMQCSGLSLEYRGILWYVSSFFFSSIFMYAILSILKEKKGMFVIALLTYLSTTFLVNHGNGSIGGRETIYYVLNLGVLRGVSGIGIGMLLAFIHDNFRIRQNGAASGWKKWIGFAVRLGIEGVTSYYCIRYFMLSERVGNHLVLVVVFCILLLSALSAGSPIAMVFNRKPFGYLGRYAYSIYVMQQTGFYILRKTIWQNTAFTDNVALCLIISTILVAALGVVTYHVVEKPCIKLYKKWIAV